MSKSGSCALVLLAIPRSSLRLKSSYLPPVGIRLRDIVVDIGLETLQRVLIPTEIKPALVNGEGVRSLGARNDSVGYSIGTKAAILRNILCRIFVKFDFIRC